MQPSESVQKLLMKLEKDAWLPVFSQEHPGYSFFGGSALFETGESLPVCQDCQGQLQLILQLALGDLPDQWKMENHFL